MQTLTRVMLVLSLFVISTSAYAQRVTVTMAGDGSFSFNGDGNAGYITDLNQPQDVCVDAAHNIYFVDAVNYVVRKISSATGLVTTIAGGGTSVADGVPATDEALHPLYMCIDAAGNIYITTDNEIKKIAAATGIITTVAGTASAGFSGDGAAATAATMTTPQGLCIDAAGNLYVADQGNNRIRKVTAATGVITTIAGSGIMGYSGDGAAAMGAQLSYPVSVCVNAAGDIFFSDQDGSYIRKISAGTGIITTIAGNGGTASGDGGPATAAGIGEVWGLCCDGGGNIFMCDISCSCRRIDAATGIITLVGGNDVATGYNGDGRNSLNVWFGFPHGVCVDNAGAVYVADQGNGRIRKSIQLTATPSFAFGKGVFVYPCSGASLSVNERAAITNMNAGETETWTVVTAPAHGTLAGFPYSTGSSGLAGLTTPSGLAYTSASGYIGTDSFKIRVSNGTLSDVLTMYASVGTLASPTVSGPASVCTGTFIGISESLAGGLLTTTNVSALLDTANPGMLWGEMAGVDTILYNIPGVCMSAAYVTVTVNTSPDAGVVSGAGIVCVSSSISLSDAAAGGIWSIDSHGTITPSGVVTGVSNGVANISYTVSNAFCTSSAVMPVTIGTPVENISGSPLACVGSPSFLGDNISGGVWTLSNTNAMLGVFPLSGFENYTGVLAGTDTVIYTVTNICGVAVATTVITINPLPDAGVISGLGSVLVGGSTTLSNPVSGGFWTSTNSFVSPINAGGVVNGVIPGTDSLVYTVSDGTCTASSYFSFTVLPVTTSLGNNMATSDKLTLAPNPAKGNFSITYATAKDEPVTINITDITGATLKTITGVTNQPVDASLQVAAGIYILTATTATGNMSGKIVIE